MINFNEQRFFDIHRSLVNQISFNLFEYVETFETVVKKLHNEVQVFAETDHFVDSCKYYELRQSIDEQTQSLCELKEMAERLDLDTETIGSLIDQLENLELELEDFNQSKPEVSSGVFSEYDSCIGY